MKFRTRLAIFALCLLVAGTAETWHGTTYRYDVRGYVLDADERPIAGSRVSIRAGAVGGSATTNARGYYSVLLRLHLEDWGQPLRIGTDHGEGTTVVRFSPDDSGRTQIHHANLLGGELSEEQLIGRDLIGWAYLIGAILLGILLMIIVLRMLRRFRPKHGRTAASVPAASARLGSKSARVKRRKRA